MDFNHIFAIRCLVALFIIIDPIGNVPVFLSLLERFPHNERRSMVKNAVVIATLVLIIFTLIGESIFNFLRVDMHSFKIAGGILLFIISIEMLFGRKSRTKISSNIEDETEEKENLIITPLAIPLLTGPGAITTSIVLFNSTGLVSDRIILLASIVIVFVISYIILSRADVIFRFLGKTGTRVFVRIMGLMLSAIAIQFVIDGVKDAMLLP